MFTSQEKRRFQRVAKSVDLRVYTQLVSGSYSLSTQNISQGGAFLKTSFLPKVGEIITYEILDREYRIVTTGNARVVRLRTDGPLDERGFAIHFNRELPTEIFSHIV